MSADHDAIVKLITKAAGAAPDLLPTKREGLRITKAAGYPSGDFVTLVTVGCSDEHRTLYRGKPVGFELTLTVVPSLVPDLVKDLPAVVLESVRRSQSGERRSPIEVNGIHAPGYAPHFFFCPDLSLTPDLSGRKPAGTRYVEFLAAIPVTDAEVRDYDRGVAGLIEKLRGNSHLADYTRRQDFAARNARPGAD